MLSLYILALALAISREYENSVEYLEYRTRVFDIFVTY